MAFIPGVYKLGVRLHDVMKTGQRTTTINVNKIVFLTINMEAGHSYVLGVKPMNVTGLRSNPTTVKEYYQYGERVTNTQSSSAFQADILAIIYDEVSNKILSSTLNADIISSVSVSEWNTALIEIRKDFSLAASEIGNAGIHGLPNALVGYSLALKRVQEDIKKRGQKLSPQTHSDYAIMSELLGMYAVRIIEMYDMKLEVNELEKIKEIKSSLHKRVMDQISQLKSKQLYLESWVNLTTAVKSLGFPEPGPLDSQ